jgi:hypothetical protein
MKARTFWLLSFAVALFSLLLANDRVFANDDTTFKWVIGSTASALAADGSMIMLTGSGTFHPDDPEEVTGLLAGIKPTDGRCPPQNLRRGIGLEDRSLGSLAKAPGHFAR